MEGKFKELTSMHYAAQAKWFLNGFWDAGMDKDHESVWKFTQKFMELDPKKKEGCELDEFWAHKFLESLGETLTVIQLRDKLRKIDMDCNGRMALLEYLAFKYSKSVKEVIDAPQGGNQKEIDEAAEKLQAVQDAFVEVQSQLDQQTQALKEQKEAEENARRTLERSKRAEQEAKTALETQRIAEENSEKALQIVQLAEETVRKAESELKAAVDDLNTQESTYKNQISKLEEKSKDPNGSTVSKNKAASELAILRGEDPLPLRKAKITQEAALRKVEKERKIAEAATAAAAKKRQEAKDATAAAQTKAQEAQEAAFAAEESAKEAESKTLALEEQKVRVEEAYRDVEAKVIEATDYLNEVKKKGGVAKGAIWWMERELKEAQKYMPKKKQTQ